MEATDQEKQARLYRDIPEEHGKKKKNGAPLHPPRRLKLRPKSVTSCSCDNM